MIVNREPDPEAYVPNGLLNWDEESQSTVWSAVATTITPRNENGTGECQCPACYVERRIKINLSELYMHPHNENMPFCAKTDVKRVCKKIAESPWDYEACRDPEYKEIFMPNFRYNGIKLNALEWFAMYANGDHGSFNEAVYLEDKYREHLSSKGVQFWEAGRSLAKTMYRINKHIDSWSEHHVYVEDVAKIVGLIIKRNESPAHIWYNPMNADKIAGMFTECDWD